MIIESSAGIFRLAWQNSYGLPVVVALLLLVAGAVGPRVVGEPLGGLQVTAATVGARGSVAPVPTYR